MFTPSSLFYIFRKNIVGYAFQLSLSLGILLGLTLLSQSVYAADNSAFCATVTGATPEECLALMDIYDNTGGPNWTTKNGWGVSTTLCTWTGVTCTSSHVSGLNLTNNNLIGNFSFSHGNLDFITTLTVSSNTLIDSLSFTNGKLVTFYGSGMTSLTSLDLHGNAIVHGGLGNGGSGTTFSALISLNLSDNKIGSATFLNATYFPALTTLNISNNPSLVSLTFNSGNLSSITATGMTALTLLRLQDNKFTTFSGAGYTSLTTLDIASNALLTSFDGTGLDSLTTLTVSNTPLTSLSFTNGKLTTFNASGMTSLASLDLHGNAITNTPGNGTAFSALTTLDISSNKIVSQNYFNATNFPALTTLNISDNPSLASLTFNSGNLSSITATGMTALTLLRLQNNKFTTFSGVGYTSLTTLDIASNALLTSFDDTGLDSLTTLTVSNTPLTSLSFTNGKLNTFNGTGMVDLTTLDLHGNKFTSFSPTSYGTALTTLDLSNNLLTSISSFTTSTAPALLSLNLSNNTVLTSVYVVNNKLTSFIGTGMTALTTLTLNGNALTSLDNTGMTALTTLTINNNKFTTFSGVGYGTLTTLNISSNLLTSFDDEGFTNLTSLTVSSNTLLESLSFTNGKLTSFGASSMTNLTTLDFHGNKLSTFPEYIFPALVSLNLSYNSYTTQSYIATGYLPSLATLDLSGNLISSFTFGNNNLSTFIHDGMTALTTLNLSSNKFTTFSGTGYGTLTTLNLSSNPLLTSFDDTGFDSLTSLTISSTPFSSFSFTNGKLATFAASSMTNLATLDLHGNKLGSFPQITFPALTILNLSDNSFIAQGYVASGYLPVLVNLDFSRNRISTFSNTWTTLKTLDLSYNYFTTLSTAAAGYASLTSLSLSHNLNGSSNSITTFTGTGLTSLTHLDLSGNKITSFSKGTGLGLLTNLNLDTNQLTSFDGSLLSSLTSLDLGNNLLLAFSNTGLTGLSTLDLSSNLLTSFNSSGYTNLRNLSLENNQITALPGITDLAVIDSLLLTTNCLSQLDLGSTVATWLNTNADDAWTARSSSCPSFCTSVTDVGELQCGALMNIFDVTSGLDWTQNEGWGISTTVCSWDRVTCTGDNITSLDLSDNNLVGIFHILEGNLNFLESLHLNNNQITSFFGAGLASVNSLNLNSNALTSFDGTGLDSLTSLNLSNNTLLTSLSFTNDTLTTFIGTGMTGLTSLNLSGNQFTSFDGSSYTTSPSLTSLNLSGNALTSFTSTSGLEALTSLNLNSNALTSFDGTGLDSLTSLNLSGNTLLTSLSFTNDTLTTFIGTGMTGLTSLNLSGNQFTSFDGSSYTTSPSLTSLNLSGNALTSFTGASGLGALTSLNLSNNTLLTSLSFTNDTLTTFIGTGMTGLTSLNLSGNQFTTFDGSSYTTSPSLTSLNLSGNALTSFTVNGGLGSLTSLNLNSNLLTSFTGTGLTSLTSLSFTNNLMSSLTGVTPLTGLGTLYATNNCFVESTLGVQISAWLDTYSTDNWLPHNAACVIPILATCSPSTISALTGDAINWTASVSGGTGIYTYSWLGTDSLTGTTNPLATTYSSAGLKTASVTITSGAQTTEPIECSTGVTISTPVVLTFCDTITDGVPKAECEALMSIYNTTGGTSWTNHNGWGTSTEICSWYGVVCNGENRVIGLDLSNNNVIGTFALTQGNLNALSDLDISNNQLTSFASTGVSALTVLDLSGNQLTVFSGSGLKALRDLDLHNNQLVSFDGTGFYLLKYLYLHNNNISSLQKVIGLKKILTLYATQNCLNGFQLDTSTVSWLDKYKSDNWQIQNQTCINTFVTPSVTIGDTTVNITWTTDNETSSIVEYGLTASTRSSTPETNISPRVTDHSINLTGLARCTTYDYRVISYDMNANSITSVGNTFTTSGCAAASTVIDTSTEQITTSDGGTLTIENTDSGGTTLNGLTLTIPSDFSGRDANFQAQQLDKTTVLETLPTPSGYALPENMVYELRAVTDDSITISTFDYPLTMTMIYGDADIVGIKEETLRIYSSNGQEGSSWSALPNCVVDTNVRTVTCSTTHFSVFALFGEADDSIPALTSPTSTSVTSTTATLGANVISLGIPDTLSARGICYGTTTSPSLTDGTSTCVTEEGSTTGIFTKSITSLTPSTTYYYRGYATNTTGTAYSDNGTFTTLTENIVPEDVIPIVTNPTSASITSTTVTIGAQVTSLGIPDTLTARGTCWGTTTSPVTNCTAEGGTTIGIFTQAVTGLTPGTTYYYRGYATNATGTAYSADGAFVTTSTSSNGGSGGSSGSSSSGSSGGSSIIPPKKPIKEPIKIFDTSLDDYLKTMLAKKHTGFATRLETVLLALKVHGRSFVANYACLKNHTDTFSKPVPGYTCQVAETAQVEKIISQTNKQFNPLQSVSRIEAYSIMMKSICIHPVTNTFNWQKEVIKKAMELGFTVRTVETFEPDRSLTKQEMYIVTKRLSDYGKEHQMCKNV